MFFKKMGAFFTLIFTSLNLYAAFCPPASVFSHEQGKPWQITVKTKLEGWEVFLDDEQNSSLTRVPLNTLLTVNLTLYLYTSVASCFYHLYSDKPGYVAIANRFHHPDMTRISEPPFEKYSETTYQCKTIASASNVCTWYWK